MFTEADGIINRNQQFRAKITPGENKNAEEELRTMISYVNGMGEVG